MTKDLHPEYIQNPYNSIKKQTAQFKAGQKI